MNALQPLVSLIVQSAPAASNALKASKLLQATARCIAVQPLESSTLTLPTSASDRDKASVSLISAADINTSLHLQPNEPEASTRRDASCL
jgi:hypothetical protein